ncbi:hypothetical protein LCGC14_2271880 [marine sediment metagenome]|uniref:Uncharacterized protein n=1 Tax=marine sediment metagenome TaxID=412755 RepID=A0A0F9DJ15_9ZZZZ
MSKVRIRGMVRLADRVRRELAGPISPSGLAGLRRIVEEALREVAGILAAEGARVSSLPGPSRTACRFLAGIDFDAVSTSEDAPSAAGPRDSVRFRGIRRKLTDLLERLARPCPPETARAIMDDIRAASGELERAIQADGVTPEQLTSQTRAIRGWLAYFSHKDNFQAYLRAVDAAVPMLAGAARKSRTYPPEVAVHFRPTDNIYRMRVDNETTRVQLPTAMISFDVFQFRLLAEFALLPRRPRRPVTDAMLTVRYRQTLAEIELFEGI